MSDEVEVLLHVFDFLGDIRDYFFALNLVCRHWRNLVSENTPPSRLLAALFTLKDESFGPRLTWRIQTLVQSRRFQRLSLVDLLGPEVSVQTSRCCLFVHKSTSPQRAVLDACIAEAYYPSDEFMAFHSHFFYQYQLLGAMSFGHPKAYRDLTRCFTTSSPPADTRDYMLFQPDLKVHLSARGEALDFEKFVASLRDEDLKEGEEVTYLSAQRVWSNLDVDHRFPGDTDERVLARFSRDLMSQAPAHFNTKLTCIF